MICDLHTHSIYSDGTFSPAEIIREAKDLGLAAVALTDHNTVSGLPDFIKEAELQGVTAVSGVELSTNYNGKEFHLLGLFIAPDRYNDIDRLAKEFHILKEISNIETIERLNDAGYMISYASVRSKNPNGNVNRAHIASELVEKGYIGSVQEAFKTVLHDDSGFYTPPDRLQLTDAIKFIRDIKAIPILAHPLNDTDEASLRELLPVAVNAGLMGIETMHSDYSRETIDIAVKTANEFGLLQSGGSDFHGGNKPDIALGKGKGALAVPAELYEKLCAAHRSL